MPLSGIDEMREAERDDRRARLGHFVIVACLLVALTNGATIWMVGNVGSRSDGRDRELSVEVDQVKVTQNEIRSSQKDGIIRGYKLRAVGCRTIEALKASLPPSCTEVAMRPYFEPVGR